MFNLNISVEMITAHTGGSGQGEPEPSSTQAKAMGSRTAQRPGYSKEMAPGRKGWAGNSPLPRGQGC